MASPSDSLPLGLVAGLGLGGGIFYYRSLVQEHMARGLTPRILMTHAEVARVLDLAAARAKQELAEYLADLLGQLARGGAQLGIIPAFAPQVCATELARLSPLPLVDLLDAIAGEVTLRHLHRVAIFGARVTMETALFGRLHGVAEVVDPQPEELSRIADLYRRIVEKERASEEEFEILRNLAHTLVERERLDAILLAGTDLSFVFKPDNTDFPHVDGARVHIAAIMRSCSA
ncbi:aspartate/glutamate racemase family protein [Acidobacteria bacterium AB60]|nr:aspartate/glutamate racemase family protein [Acidobacteria bacterium AB60]